MAEQRRIPVLVTGAYGLIGNLVYARLAAQPESYDVYGMVRRLQPSERAAKTAFREIPADKLRLADLTDAAAVQRAVAGMDVVVHMAADPDGRAGWESVRDNNIIGVHHVFEASRLAGVRRVVFASTNQVVFGYGAEEPYASLFAGRFDDLPAPFQPIDHTRPARPLNEYACSKVYGEALAHMYAHAHDLSCICLRIGWVTSDDRLPAHPMARILWCSQRDVVQIVERCIRAPESLRFDVFFAQSDNLYNFVDIGHTRDVLGYAPEDRAEDRLRSFPHV